MTPSTSTSATATMNHPAASLLMTPNKTPLRMKAPPRMSPAPSYGRKRRSQRSHRPSTSSSGTPLSSSSSSSLLLSSPSFQSCDRFIPNRSKMNVSQVRATLMNGKNDASHNLSDDLVGASITASDGDQRNDNGRLPAVTPQKHAYERHLRRGLLGLEDYQPRLLSFGDPSSVSLPSRNNNRSSASMEASTITMEDPFRQDVLRTMTTASSSSSSPSSLTSRNYSASLAPRVTRRKVSTHVEFVLNAPLVLQNDYLNVISYGPMIAVGLDRAVYFSNRGNDMNDSFSSSQQAAFESIQHEHDYVTAVQWNSDGRSPLLAFGSKCCAEVWDPVVHQQVAYLGGHTDYVTALAWGEGVMRPKELFAASSKGIRQYDLRNLFPDVALYRGDEGSYPVTSLQCRGNYMVASYDDTISIWDVRKHGEPLTRLHHAKVKALEFCPFQPNVLASGGSDGVKVWKLDHQTLSSSGTNANLRVHILTSSPVTSLLWSPYRRELLAGHGEHLAVWDMSTSNTVTSPLAEWNTEGTGAGGTVLSLDRDPRSGRVVSLHSHEKLVCWDAFGKAPRDNHTNGGIAGLCTGRKSGLLEMPVVR